MYLKRLKISNFRKFRGENNVVEFVNSRGIQSKGVYENIGMRLENEEVNFGTQSSDINVASVTTLIVGKNNAGKTTVVKALEKILSRSQEKTIEASDFNLRYLAECLKNFETNLEIAEMPFIEFVFTIALEEDSDDRVTNLIPFMLLEDAKDSELEICVRYEIAEKEIFKNAVKEMLQKYRDKENIKLYKFLICINKAGFKVNYYDKNGECIEKEFRLSNLIEIQHISANKVTKDTCLSEAFSKIVKYQYDYVFNNDKKNLEYSFDDMNESLTNSIKENYTEKINNSLSKILSMNHMKVSLTADITFEKVINSLVKYQYVEKDLNIPEDQFGLGYTNLMMIIAHLIDYMEHYPDTSFNSKINLISIEEPETYMHPQMQELFIKNINDALHALLESKNKVINSQLIITTHSSHILNSKIHSGNSFDNINYIYEKEGYSAVANLNNSVIVPNYVDNNNSAEFKFLKKHIKYKVSELFFSDAVIFVEGMSEDTLLPFYIERRSKLNKYYVSVFNVNGAHAFMYQKLIKILGVPALIITDLDIKKMNTEENKNDIKSDDDGVFEQISDLSGMETTNQTIVNFRDGQKEIYGIDDYIQKDSIYLAYQGKINNFYATSFEEAYILTNYDNCILNDVLKEIKPRVYERIVNGNIKNNISHSREWQKKLSDSKSDFASRILYKIIENDSDEDLPKLPNYIESGLDWLEEQLREGKKNEFE